jgi:hypothetical protein
METNYNISDNLFEINNNILSINGKEKYEKSYQLYQLYRQHRTH